jgi:hypothetical protein
MDTFIVMGGIANNFVEFNPGQTFGAAKGTPTTCYRNIRALVWFEFGHQVEISER